MQISNHHTRESIQHDQNGHLGLDTLQEDSLVVNSTRETLRRLKATLKRTTMAWSRFLSEDAEQLEVRTTEDARRRLRSSFWDIHASNERMEMVSEKLSDLENVVDNLKAQASDHSQAQ